MEADLLHPNQSAYRKRVSCADTNFFTQEVINIRIFKKEVRCTYMCFYDLQRAFDSVKFPVLLNSLFHVGVNSKT